jgi:hypothetical protein
MPYGSVPLIGGAPRPSTSVSDQSQVCSAHRFGCINFTVSQPRTAIHACLYCGTRLHEFVEECGRRNRPGVCNFLRDKEQENLR